MRTEYLPKEVTPVIDEPACDGYQISSKEQGDTKRRKYKEHIEISAVKKLYDAIIERKITSEEAIQRVLAIECLERFIGYEFTSTKDFRNKMEHFFSKHYYRGADLRRARKWSGMERLDLADLFGVSINTIKKMETNKKALSQKAIDFIIAMGFKKTVPLKKKKKKASEHNCIQTTKIDKIAPEKKLQNSQVSDTFKCEVCNEWKDDWEVTIECIDSYRAQFVCEACLSNSKKRKEKHNESKK